MADTKYTGTSWSVICPAGGSVKVALSSGVGQGNGGTSLPCKGCFVQADAANTEVVKVNIATAASANLGVDLAFQDYDSNNSSASQPFFIPIDDVSKLYFFSTDVDAVVQIMYLLG